MAKKQLRHKTLQSASTSEIIQFLAKRAKKAMKNDAKEFKGELSNLTEKVIDLNLRTVLEGTKHKASRIKDKASKLIEALKD